MASLRSPGFLIIVASLEFLFLEHLAEFLYPGYSVSGNHISDLGVGPAAPRALFTMSVIAFGVLVGAAAFLLRERDSRSSFWLLLVLSGVGAVGVGIFNEDYISPVHFVFSLMAFLFGNLAVVCSYKLLAPPLCWISVLLGLLGLSAMVLYGAGVYLGLGQGGMERMMFYPAMFWAIAFGAYLLEAENAARNLRISLAP